MKRGWITWCGLGIVAAAAAVLSFDALRELAVMVGTPEHLAPLLPVTIDAAALVAARVWLAGGAPDEAVAFARVLALVMIAVSVGGNATAHGMVAYGVDADWWTVVAVASVPPLVLAALVHLAHLASAGDEAGNFLGSQETPGHGDEAENFTGSREVSADALELVGEANAAREQLGRPPLVDFDRADKGPGSVRTPGEGAHSARTPGDRWAEHNGSPGEAGKGTHDAGTPGDPGELVDRARRLVAEHGHLGRGRLARELGVTEHRARRILAELDGLPVRLVS